MRLRPMFQSALLFDFIARASRFDAVVALVALSSSRLAGRPVVLAIAAAIGAMIGCAPTTPHSSDPGAASSLPPTGDAVVDASVAAVDGRSSEPKAVAVVAADAATDRAATPDVASCGTAVVGAGGAIDASTTDARDAAPPSDTTDAARAGSGGAMGTGGGIGSGGATGAGGNGAGASNGGGSGGAAASPGGSGGDTGSGSGDVGLPKPGAGDLAIVELLINPAGTDTGREWIEIVNRTAHAIDLAGLVVADAANEAPVVFSADQPGANVLPAGAWAILIQSADPTRNGGVTLGGAIPGGSFGTLVSLNNDADTITVCERTCASGVAIARVSWDASLGAGYDGHALVIDDAGRRCPAMLPFGDGGSFGTPGTANTSCP